MGILPPEPGSLPVILKDHNLSSFHVICSYSEKQITESIILYSDVFSHFFFEHKIGVFKGEGFLP